MATANSKLIAAIKSGKLSAVQVAIAAGQNVNQPKSEPPLARAAFRGNIRIVKALLAAGANPNGKDSLDEAVLSYARKPQIAALLIEAGADPNHVSKKMGNGALHIAAANNKQLVAEALLQGGAGADLRDHDGNTPLITAARRGKAPMVKLLLKHQADPSAANKVGDTAFHVGAGSRSAGSPAIVKLLMAAGANIEVTDAQGKTPLMRGSYWGNLAVVDLLLKAGANVNARSKFNDTALLCAVLSEDIKVAHRLINAGADRSVRISPKHFNKNLAGKSLAEIAGGSSKAIRRLFSD